MTKSVHHATRKAADKALAEGAITEQAHAAVLAGEMSLADAKALGRNRGPDTPEGRSGPRQASGGPREGQERPADALQEAHSGCLCGCGGIPKGKNSRFLMGHDHRLFGELKRNLQKDPLLRNERFTDEQRRYAVERGLVGPEALPEEENDG